MNCRKFLKLLSASASGVGMRELAAHPTSGNIQSQNSKSSDDNSPHKNSSVDPRIDRHALVTRHNIVLTASDVMSPLSVGNGEFAFTADVTGLQTFEADHNAGIPLSTMSQWGFHSMPNPQGYSLDKFPLTTLDTSGRPVGYLYYQNGKSPKAWENAANYLYANPSRLHLGRIALALKTKDGQEARRADLTAIHQELDLWTGQLHSHFVFDGLPVEVTTCCHPDKTQVAVHIESPLIGTGQLAVLLAFPYGTSAFNGNGADWSQPNSHHTVLTRNGERRADFDRTLDGDRYHTVMTWSQGGALSEKEPHHYLLTGQKEASDLDFCVAFSQALLLGNLPDTTHTRSAAAAMWKDFWSKGGAIDLSQSKDPRWKELERRIVLSQYLTRIQCAGSLPPQETGLTCNSWSGKFHLEMHWWHAAHFPLWDRTELLERSLPFYQRILPKARAQAKQQGHAGALAQVCWAGR